jgi:carboxyl-terminal processing protease
MLIDGESASASEIVAGAIRDHNRGTLIGKRTYGKGTIQKINTVPMGTAKNVWSGFKLTTEKFYSPKGSIYSGVGVTPHIVISDENQQWTTSARPVDGRVPLPRPRSASSPDDPYIQEAVRVSQAL